MAVSCWELSESRIFADSADGADFGDFCLLSVFVRMARLETLTVWGRKLESLRYKHQRSAAVSGRWSVVEVRTLASGEGAQTGKFAVQTSAVSGRWSVVEVRTLASGEGGANWKVCGTNISGQRSAVSGRGLCITV